MVSSLPEYFIHLYAYNTWANQRILTAALVLTSEQLFQEHGHSWGSVQGTLVHMMGAEWIWLRRWNGESPRTLPRPEDFPTSEYLRSAWASLDEELTTFVASQTDESLQRDVRYTNTKGRSYTVPLWQLMAHVANHSTHHRGELAAMFALMNAPHPEEDYFIYYLIKSGQMEE